MQILKSFPSLFFAFSAALAGMAMDFPQIFWILGLFFLLPILFYLDFVRREGVSTIAIAGRMFVFGVIFSTISTAWMISLYPLDWLGISSPFLSIFLIASLWLSFSFAMALPMTLWVFVDSMINRKNFLLRALAGASGWLFLEYVRSWFVALSIYSPVTMFGPHHTYYSLGYLTAHIPFLKEILPIGGIYLATFSVILINYFIYSAFFLRKAAKMSRFYLFLLICMIIMSSFMVMKEVRAEEKNTFFIPVTVLNTHFASLPDLRNEENKQKTAMEALASAENHNSIIVLPENLNVLFPKREGLIVDNTSELKKHPVVIGSYSGEKFSNFFFVDSANEKALFYRKQILMPLGEYDISWLKFLWKIFAKTDISMPKSLEHFMERGNGIVLFKSSLFEGVSFFGSLCSENISPYIYRSATRLGATILLNLASHAPFHGSHLLTRQTIAIDTVRALENGRYFIVASNYSLSFIINDKGEMFSVSSSTAPFSYFNASVVSKSYMTPYIRYGDYILYIAFMILSFAFMKHLHFNNK